MPRLKLEVADIFRAHGGAYRREHTGHLNPLSRMQACAAGQ